MFLKKSLIFSSRHSIVLAHPGCSLINGADEFLKNNVADAYSDPYTKAFFPTCESLAREAEAAIASSDLSRASSLYLRIAALYRISRFPIVNPDVKWKAWEAQKDAYVKAVKG